MLASRGGLLPVIGGKSLPDCLAAGAVQARPGLQHRSTARRRHNRAYVKAGIMSSLAFWGLLALSFGMERVDQFQALVQRNRLLLAEAAELRADVQRMLVQLRTLRGFSWQRQRQWHDLRDLRRRAREAASEAAECRVIAEHLRAQVAAMLNHRTDS